MLSLSVKLLRRRTALFQKQSFSTNVTTTENNIYDVAQERTSSKTVTYTGNVRLPITYNLHIVRAEQYRDGSNNTILQGKWPVYRVLDESGRLMSDPEQGMDAWGKKELMEVYRYMIRLRVMDEILENAQRQGRISFYLQARGEEAIHIGSAKALDLKDTVFGQYREQGVILWRGFTMEQITDQCFSNECDLGRGRQMPIHYGSKALNYHTISSPLATQMPHAVGAAYFLKLHHNRSKQNVEDKSCSIVYFGDGAASEGDFHAALNMAATLECPTIFFCRNNGYAISTPVDQQYCNKHCDGIVGRGPGYGIPSIRVDGNDIFAVYNATKAAKRLAVAENTPVLIEAMTYRIGHHSTSDDSTQYRSREERERWAKESDPIVRLSNFISLSGVFDSAQNDYSSIVREIENEERQTVLNAIAKSENKKKPSISTMFTDVYDEKPQHLQQQEEFMINHISKYPDRYGKFE